MKLAKRFVVKPGSKVDLSRRKADFSVPVKKKDAEKLLKENIARLDELQYLLYAEQKHALLIVLQAMDAAGKDGTIRHVMGALNPQGVRVSSFKAPSAEEKAHDFLWRIHKSVPARGMIGVFNRSHYEDVLVVRVHKLVPKSVWSARYDQINRFEEILAKNDVTILKFFLHIDKDEQKERFLSRLQDKEKNWKASQADFAEREHWDDYTKAYEEALSRCSTKHAPWYVIPANRKWFRNLAVSEIILEALESLDMKFPPPPADLDRIVVK